MPQGEDRSIRSDAFRATSFWHDSLDDVSPRDPLDGSLSVDVAIVGGGYTGLWSAYYLTSLQPDLSVAIIEAEMVGHGASGRNGGWASGEFSMLPRKVAEKHGAGAVADMVRAVWSSIDEIGRVTAAEGFDAHFEKGGSVAMATSPAQEIRLREHLAAEHRGGFDESDFRWLDRDELAVRVRSDKARGAVFTPHCAAIHPARLARGLARVLEARGVRIFDATRALSIEPGVVATDRGDVRAATVLRCVEAFEPSLPDGGRRLAPVYSLMIATEPLPESVWDDIGFAGRETFHDGRHLVIYGQRTVDGRFAFSGRGAPYHFGSAMDPAFEQDPATHANLSRTLRWLFPQIGDARITHTWGGAVAVPRDWTASVTFDRSSGIGRAGGYVGAGVTPSNLAGRTLADLVLGRDTDRTRLPWVGHVSRRWEPEPLRWIGINLGRSLAPMADRREFATGRPARVLGGVLERLTGH